MASHHFIVLVDQTCWRVVHVRGQQALAMRTFECDDSRRQEILRWWQQFPQARVSFLTNHADENYHVETLPQVRGSAGRQLLMRKLAAWPFSQGMHAVCRLGHVKTLRRESRFLFVALTYPALSHWLSVLQVQPIRVQGVYTQALCLVCWLSATLQGVMHGLCVQYTAQQVRFSYIHQRRLFFSRLISLPSDTLSTPEDFVGRIAQEVAQIRMTLIHQHWLQEADALSLVWLGQAPVDLSLFKAQLPAGCVWAEISDMDGHSRNRDLPSGLHAMEWAAIQPILKGGPLPNLAPEPVLLLDSSARIKRHLHWAGAAMVCLMALICWVSIQATYQAQVQMQQVKRQLQVGQRTPAEHINQAQFSGIRALTQAVQGLQASVRLPEHALALMQQALTGLPHWQVASLAWDFSESSPQVDAATQHPSRWRETLTVTWLQGDRSEQAAMEWQQLLTRLRGLPEIEKVEVLTPSASSSNAQRQGNTGQAPAPDQPPVLKLYLRDVNQAAT